MGPAGKGANPAGPRWETNDAPRVKIPPKAPPLVARPREVIYEPPPEKVPRQIASGRNTVVTTRSSARIATRFLVKKSLC